MSRFQTLGEKKHKTRARTVELSVNLERKLFLIYLYPRRVDPLELVSHTYGQSHSSRYHHLRQREELGSGMNEWSEFRGFVLMKIIG